MPGFPVPHYLMEFAQVHVHCISDALQLSHPLLPLLLPSTFPSIRVFSDELFVSIRRPKYWSFSFSISPSNEYSGLISFIFFWCNNICCFFFFHLILTSLIPFLSKGLSRVFSNTTVRKNQFFCTLPTLWSSSQNHT